MKQIRSKSTVLLDAQTNKRGIAIVKLEEFKFLGNTSIVLVGYYEQILNVGAEVGQPMFNLLPLPVKDGVVGRPNVKRVSLSKTQMDGLFQAVDTSILKSGSFNDQLAGVLTTATLIKVVMDENYSQVSESNVLTVLTAQDWEIIMEQELVTE